MRSLVKCIPCFPSILSPLILYICHSSPPLLTPNLICKSCEKMPISETHREVKVMKDDHSHDHHHTGGSFTSLMRRVCSLEDMLKKLRWERSAVKAVAEEEVLQAGPQSDGKSSEFRMPLHYPRYSKADYESMAEWRLDILLHDYGLDVRGDVEYKRNFAIGAFLWPDQCL